MMTRMGDDAFAKPSSLPDWTRAHLLTHVARNADALINLLTWARTGVPTPAYASVEQRNADIEAGAKRPPAEIRADLLASSDRLAAAVRKMPEEAWSARVEFRGRRILAADLLWLRAREVWIHAIDLDAGASFADLPRPMLRELLTDAAGTLGARPDFPRLILAPSDESRTWTVGEGSDPLEVRGPAAELAAWLLGRSKGRDLRTAEGKRPPALPSWL
jgi:maleylpyruvate isomerase